MKQTKCGFCNAKLNGNYRYIYPIPVQPDQEGRAYPFHGEKACMTCAPIQARLQKAQGLLVNGHSEGVINVGKSKSERITAGLAATVSKAD